MFMKEKAIPCIVNVLAFNNHVKLFFPLIIAVVLKLISGTSRGSNIYSFLQPSVYTLPFCLRRSPPKVQMDIIKITLKIEKNAYKLESLGFCSF